MQSSTTMDVERLTLENGLTVLLKTVTSSPVVAVMTHVRVGYFNEPDRYNGLSHVIEHMYFKGTRARPGKEQIAEEVRAIGGTINASTYYEETAYYIVAPAEHLEKTVEIQSDAFMNSQYDAEELAKEIEVIIQESRQKRDNPGAMLVETMYSQAYDHHRLRRWRIGTDDTLRAMRREDLLAFTAQTYRPENVILTLVGDLDVDRARGMVERYWAAMPRGELQKEISPIEPNRTEFRYHRMRGAIQQRLLDIGFHAPPILHGDAPALMVLGALLSDGRSARLYRALKEEQRLANSVWAGYEGFEHLGVFTMGAETVDDDPLAAERALITQVERILEDPVGEDELARIKTRIQSRRLFVQEDVLGMARNLTAYEALGDYRLADELAARLDAVTSDDVRRVAEAYLAPHRATLVEYLPDSANAPERSTQEVLKALTEGAGRWGQGSGKGPGAGIQVSGSVSETRTARPMPHSSSPIQVHNLPGGTTLLCRPRRDLPIVSIHILLPGGKRMETPETAGLTNLMLKSAMKGTESFTAEEIAARIEGLGTGIGLPLAPDAFGYSLKILADRVEEALVVLKEVIAKPTFPVEEVEKEKQSIYGEIRRQRDSMFANAMDLFNRACFGDRAYGLPVSGMEEAVAAVTTDHLRAWHDRWVRSEAAVVAVVGDIEAERLADLLADALPAGAPDDLPDCAVETTSPGEQSVHIARQQTASVMGFPGATITDDDRHALDVIAEITSGLAGRFFQAVRGDNALAYAVSAYHRARCDAGNFITYTATSPENETRARDILLAECARLARDPVSQQELRDAQAVIRGEHVIGTQTYGAQAAEMASMRLFGLPLDAPERYLARVDAVSTEEIQTVAARYLTPDRFWLGVVRGQ